MTSHTTEIEPESEGELLSAFESLRPEPGEFAAGVRARIEEAEQREESQVARFAAAPERLRWAASILPPGLVAGATGAAGLAGKKLGFKLVPGLLAIPAITFLVLIGTFLGGVHSLRKEDGQPQDVEGDERAFASDWWKRNRKLVTVGFTILLLLALFQHTEVFTALIALSMISTVLLLGDLARAGLADRARVAKATARLLWWSGFLWFYTRDFLPVDPSGYPNWFSAVVLGFGAIGCLFAGGVLTWRMIGERIWYPDRRMLYPDAVTTFCLRGLYSFFALFAGAVILGGIGVMGLVVLNSTESRSHLVEFVEEFDAPITETHEWREFKSVSRSLASDGGTAPDFSQLRERVGAELASGAQTPFLGSGPILLELGVVSASEVPGLIEDARVHVDSHSAYRLDGNYLSAVRTLFEAGELSAEQHAQLTEHVRTGIAGISGVNSLETLLEATWVLDALGEGELVESLRPQVHAELLAHWRGAMAASHGAAFAQNAERESGWFTWRSLIHLDYVSTQQAVALMKRYGAPPEVDLGSVRETLRMGRSKGRATSWDDYSNRRDLLAVSALVQLEELAPEPVGPLSQLFKHRSLFGALLLICLCLFATLRAPKLEELA